MYAGAVTAAAAFAGDLCLRKHASSRSVLRFLRFRCMLDPIRRSLNVPVRQSLFRKPDARNPEKHGGSRQRPNGFFRFESP